MARPPSKSPSRQSGKVVPFRRPAKPKAQGTGRGFAVLLVALPLAAFAAVFLWQGPPQVSAQGLLAAGSLSTDRESARFAPCDGPVRVTCVVDGDTIWYEGTKIRIADINAPELSDPQCASEAALARRATQRLTALLNAGPFTLESIDRSEDKYGRALKVITRDGESLGDQLVAEGLAEEWRGRRRDWC